MLKQILLGLVIAGLGILMTWKTNIPIQMIGQVAWAEKTFGPGGTRTYYKLFGLALIFVGFIIATDLFNILFGKFIMGLFGMKSV